MKISELEKRLQKIKADKGDIEVMFDDPESSNGPWAASGVHVEVSDGETYPEEFDMPKGFTFVEITAY